MPVINSIAAMKDEMTEWRQDIHMHPELGFEEFRTSNLVAEKLEAWGIEVHRGIGQTGVVGVLRGSGESSKSIGLRADMDALPMDEENDFAHKSRHEGKFHGCGHDGHTTMLLGAAKYLAETRNFDGTVHFIFQPAEEGKGGGKAMVDDGLFERFDSDEVYGMHNWPAIPAGEAAIRPGPMMAAADHFNVTISATGGHAAMPHYTVDPVLIATQIVQAFQTLVSRNTNPIEPAVLSVTQMHIGSADNVIADGGWMQGTVRTFSRQVQDDIEAGMKRIVESTAATFGAEATLTYNRGYPATVNHAEQTEKAARVAERVMGDGKVNRDFEPVMGAEDFSFMLEKRPGAYIAIGQAGGPSSCMVHNPRYDFNDEILPVGASFFATLVESELARAG
ncbi:MAG: M20 aminoacylase family protein [Pseudomonadota bacterium]